MRITLLNQFYLPDVAPTAHLAASLAEHRAALGDEVQVITSTGGYVAKEAVDYQQQHPRVRIRRMWTPRLGKSNHLFRLIDYASFYLAAALTMLFSRPQDVIITMTTPPLIGLTAIVHKLLHRNCKIVLWNMDCYPDVLEAADVIKPGGILSRMLRWLTRIEFRAIDHLVTLDPAMSELLVSQYAPPHRQIPITVIPNWERADLFPTPTEPQTWPAATELGLDGRFTLLYLGNTGYGHRFDTVVDAAMQLRGERVAFLFVGGGKRWAELEDAKRRHQLDNVVLHGYVPKEWTPAVMQHADCALITLHDWSLGIMSPSKLHANLAMHLPVVYVGPATSNVDQAIEEYACGVSLRNGDAAGLVAFVRQCLADPEQLTELRSRARRAFDSSYCDTRTLPQFDAILRELVPAA